jgi:hypothetical protein
MFATAGCPECSNFASACMSIRISTGYVKVLKDLCGSPQSLHNNIRKLTHSMSRAVAQAISRRLPMAISRVRARGRSSGICGGQRDWVAQ